MNRRSFLKMLGIGAAVAAVVPAVVKSAPKTQTAQTVPMGIGQTTHNPRGYRMPIKYELWDSTGTNLKGIIAHNVKC